MAAHQFRSKGAKQTQRQPKRRTNIYSELRAVDGLVQHIANGDSLSLRENLLGIVRQLQFSNPIELTFWNQRDINAVGSHGATLLMTAASCDNTDAINILWTRRDLHLNVADGQRNTALHHASERNCTAAARCLLKLGANPNILNERGYSPLHTAIISKQLDMLAVFVMIPKINLEVPSRNGLVPLSLCILQNHVDGCRLLVRKGASLTLRTSPDALPPLHLAASHGTLACIEVMFASLLSSENPPNIDALDSLGRSALLHAVLAGSFDTVSFLLCKGANPCLKDATGDSVLHHALESGREKLFEVLVAHAANIDVLNSDMQSPLHKAAKEGFDQAVEKLLHLGAKLLQKDRFGQPPIFLACKQGHDGIVSRVLESNSQQSTVTDHRGWTLFHWAAALGQVAMCKVLQQFGVDAMAVASGGHTPSLIAADQGDVGMVTWFVEQGLVQPHHRDDEGRTLLHAAAANGWGNLCQSLVTLGFDPNACTCQGWTPLFYAAQKGHVEVARQLLQAGCNPELRDVHSIPALHYAAACLNNGSDLLCRLLSAQCRSYNLLLETTVDEFQGTALDTAYRHHNPVAAHALFESGVSCQYVIRHRAAARVQACWRLRCTLKRQQQLDASSASQYSIYLRPMLLSHAALVRLHYRHVAWRIHASFLKSMSIEQTIPEELEAMLAIASQRAARLKPGLKAGRRLRASSLQQAMSPSTLKLPTLRSKGATSPVAQRLTEQANQRRRKLKDGYQAQQQELELLKEQNQLLENLNRQQAKALVIAKGSSDGRTRGLEYGGAQALKANKLERQKLLIAKYQNRVNEVKQKLTTALDVEQTVLEAGDSASTFQTDGQKELVKVQQQAARRGLKTALAEVADLKSRAKALAVTLQSS